MQQAVLFHTHGLGPFDFSTLAASDLLRVDSLAAERNVLVCPTVYLTESGFSLLLIAPILLKTKSASSAFL